MHVGSPLFSALVKACATINPPATDFEEINRGVSVEAMIARVSSLD